jgi:hypothetical protein
LAAGAHPCAALLGDAVFAGEAAEARGRAALLSPRGHGAAGRDQEAAARRRADDPGGAEDPARTGRETGRRAVGAGAGRRPLGRCQRARSNAAARDRPRRRRGDTPRNDARGGGTGSRRTRAPGSRSTDARAVDGGTGRGPDGARRAAGRARRERRYRRPAAPAAPAARPAGSAAPADPAITDAQVQPASLDLRLGHTAWRVRASFLPAPAARVADRLANSRCTAST